MNHKLHEKTIGSMRIISPESRRAAQKANRIIDAALKKAELIVQKAEKMGEELHKKIEGDARKRAEIYAISLVMKANRSYFIKKTTIY